LIGLQLSDESSNKAGGGDAWRQRVSCDSGDCGERWPCLSHGRTADLALDRRVIVGICAKFDREICALVDGCGYAKEVGELLAHPNSGSVRGYRPNGAIWLFLWSATFRLTVILAHAQILRRGVIVTRRIKTGSCAQDIETASRRSAGSDGQQSPRTRSSRVQPLVRLPLIRPERGCLTSLNYCRSPRNDRGLACTVIVSTGVTDRVGVASPGTSYVTRGLANTRVFVQPSALVSPPNKCHGIHGRDACGDMIIINLMS
jgi:hypothetical protein